jgi:hypothetical protein
MRGRMVPTGSYYEGQKLYEHKSWPGFKSEKKMTKDTANIWESSHTTVQDTSSAGAIISKFMSHRRGEMMTVRHEMTIKVSILEIADTLKAALKAEGIEAFIRSDSDNWLAIEAENVLAIAAINEDRNSPSYDDDGVDENPLLNETINTYRITLVSDRVMLFKLLKVVKDKYHSKRFARIKWWYDEGGRSTFRTTYLDAPDTVLRPEFYPYMRDEPQSYIKRYLASKSSVLLLAGPPGTGKTTLLRHMICDNNLSASVVYDEQIMQRDNVFQSFLFDKKDDVLIIEDADTILLSREDDNNRLMNRFLNVSDGLIKLPNKKLVFTTNITDFTKVDSALMRPGRCFDVLLSRPLTYHEACLAASVSKVEAPTDPNKGYTVAELFNHDGKTIGRRVGFTAA